MRKSPIGAEDGISHFMAGSLLAQAAGESTTNPKFPPPSRAETIALAQVHALLEIAACLRKLSGRGE